MARIRSLKPDFFRSVSIAKLSWGARLTFEGLWCHADDDGRYRYEPALVKADVWPLDDDVTAKEAEQLVDELEANGRVCVYMAEGRRYLHIVNWDEHQKIDRKGQSRLPPCPKDSHGSPSPQRAFGEDSTSPQRARGESSELDLGSRSKDLGEGTNTVVEQARPDDPTQTVFDAWRQATGKHRARLDDKRLRKIKAALRSYSLADVLDAVRGWQHSPHHRGENEQGTVYNELDLLLRDAAHIEQFRDLWRHGPPARISRQTAQAMRTSAAMRARAEGVNRDLRRVGGPGGPSERGLPAPAD